MLIRLLLPTKSFRRTLLNHFISKVVHDLFSFRREVLANGPRLCQVRFIIIIIIHEFHGDTSLKQNFRAAVQYRLKSATVSKMTGDDGRTT